MKRVFTCESAIVAEKHSKIYTNNNPQNSLVMLTFQGKNWMPASHISRMFYTVHNQVIEALPIEKPMARVNIAACGR